MSPARPSQSPPSWSLNDQAAPATQGFVVTGFGALPFGRALFLQLPWEPEAAPAGWLARLLAAAPVTPAIRPDGAPQTRAASLAFTATGLRRAGLTAADLDTFSRPFRQGMHQEDRLRRLGDRRRGVWADTVRPGGPLWSGNTPIPDLPPPISAAFDVPHDGPPEAPATTTLTIHALLLLFAATEADDAAWAATVEPVLAADGIAIVRTRELLLDVERQGGFSREHFGFADALSQPLPYDADGAVLAAGKPVKRPDPVQGVPLGEFLLGYVNGHHDIPPGPAVADRARAAQAGLPPAPDASGFFDFGRNGSYLVVRELAQAVGQFWTSMAEGARQIQAVDPRLGHVDAAWLAARVVGRDQDGHLLCPNDARLPPCADGAPDSGYRFLKTDGAATGCPPGSHVRRAFPRDALAPTPDDADTLLRAANNHRILRRGRKFGPPWRPGAPDQDADRGLLFMCLNTDIERQFEFVQQTWLLNPTFATLYQETDPLIGPAGPMTIRDGAPPLCPHIDTFVRLTGGEYFFLPSLPALAYLAAA